MLCAGLIASAATAFAGEQNIPTPPPSGYVDTESSVNVPIADWARLRRRFTLALAANTSPTGCVQVAFGRDTNGDECLEPEETELVVGNDCGAGLATRRAREPVAVRGTSRRDLAPCVVLRPHRKTKRDAEPFRKPHAPRFGERPVLLHAHVD